MTHKQKQTALDVGAGLMFAVFIAGMVFLILLGIANRNPAHSKPCGHGHISASKACHK